MYRFFFKSSREDHILSYRITFVWGEKPTYKCMILLFTIYYIYHLLTDTKKYHSFFVFCYIFWCSFLSYLLSIILTQHINFRHCYRIRHLHSNVLYSIIVLLFKVDSWYTAILDCTITVQNWSSYLPKSANLETDLQFNG